MTEKMFNETQQREWMVKEKASIEEQLKENDALHATAKLQIYTAILAVYDYIRAMYPYKRLLMCWLELLSSYSPETQSYKL